MTIKRLLRGVLLALCGVMAFTGCGGDGAGGDEISNESISLKNGGYSIPIGANETTYIVDIVSNCSWTVGITDNSNWQDLRIMSGSSGTGNQNINLSTSANTTTSRRNAKLTFTTRSGRVVSFNITQEAGTALLTITPENKLDFDANGEEFEFDITSSGDWKAETSYEWIQFVGSPEGKAGSSRLKVKVGENPDAESRTGQINVIGDTGKIITVTQKGKSYAVTINPRSLSMNAVGDTAQVKLTCNGSWLLSIDKDWCKANKQNGSSTTSNGEIITLICDPNTTEAERPNMIRIVAGHNAVADTIHITQTAGKRPEVTKPEYTLLSSTELSLTATYTSMFDVTEYGFFYGETPNPTQKHPVGQNGGKTGSFEATLTLQDGKTYYFRTYAISAVGTGDSKEDITVKMHGKQPGKDDNDSPGI